MAKILLKFKNPHQALMNSKKIFLLLTLFIIIQSGMGQAITSLNFNHWYNPQNEVSLRIHLARGEKEMIVNYQLKTTQFPADKYSITWERRDSYSTREGASLTEKDTQSIMSGNQKVGLLTFPIPEKPWILLAKVTHIESQKSWYYFKLMEAIYPVKGWIENTEKTVTDNFLYSGKYYTLKSCDEKPMYVSYYKTTSFYQPYPPFSDKAAKIDRFLFHDSTFRLASEPTFSLSREGLYLFQQDTTDADGFSVRVVPENFPKYTKIDDLADPLIFVTTQDEYKQLVAAGNEKAKFDKVILDITRDKDRAKNFMRSYFRRVELANQYFSSFKEGWKTDRGMIYLVFGMPDELSKNGGNEVWNYRSFGARFTFVKSGSVYDADNYVLLRDKRFQEAWFSTIDLWRKSRF
jgi:GWxTD domain-containing protein